MSESRGPKAPLSEYAAKRDFEKTPEPSDKSKRSPRKAASHRLRFVVQMHRATRLHYDFRLEDEGVLKSWAIPKGPSFDPADKRLAMHVEDHPFDYRDFEGIIPKGNYGAGEVVVWDRGWYKLVEGTSTTEQIAKGKIKFILHGRKLHGMFSLVHIRGRDGEENAWLLVKDHDEFVDPKWRVEDHDESVKSGQTIRDIARDPKAPHWISRAVEQPKRARHAARQADAVPTITKPMLATTVAEPFDDPAWLYEIKWDGYRAIATIAVDGSVTLASRNGKDFLEKFGELKSLADAFTERPLVVDGEIVVLDAEGHASFQALQNRVDRFGRSNSGRPVTFVAFDLLYGNGRDLRKEPLEQRKAALEALVRDGHDVLFSKHVIGNGIALYDVAVERGLEGIVAKRRASTYQEQRSTDWRKIKTERRQEFVIGGWTEPRGSRSGFGALLLGVYEGDDFVSVGSVGTGFDARLLREIHARLLPIERKTSAFVEPPKTPSPAHWTRPTLVAEVKFAEWTDDGQLRHPAFVALRSDKDAREVVRE